MPDEANHQGLKERPDLQLAATLIRLGMQSGLYFDYLAGYARAAVEDRTPFFPKYDAQGRFLRGEFSAAFENWCAQNKKDPRTVAATQFSVYPEDVLILAQAQDPRAGELFRKGLDSPNLLVFGYCVQGLGRLRDGSVIPLIAQVADRVTVGDRLAIAMQLPWYSLPEAERLLLRLVPDRGTRDHLRDDVHRIRLAELNRALQRSGSAPRQTVLH